jgi:hypothetical protein
MWRIVLHLRGRSAGVCRVGGFGPLAIQRLARISWRSRSGALPRCGAHSHQSATPTEHGSMARTGAPGALRGRRVGGFGSKTVDSDSWPSPIEVITPPRTAMSTLTGFGSEVHIQWSPDQSVCGRWNRSLFLSAGTRVQRAFRSFAWMHLPGRGGSALPCRLCSPVSSSCCALPLRVGWSWCSKSPVVEAGAAS